ncbi:MAG: ABC1 kinase family protein [Bacillota bacterium]
MAIPTSRVPLRKGWHTLLRLLQIVGIAAGEWAAWRLGRRPAPEAVYRAVVRLGPTFVKLGQVASTRPDLVPEAISQRLRQLQEGVPPFSTEAARTVVEEELGMPLQEAFRSFPSEPVAAASLSQVYLAELADGAPVAVKIQRPGLRPVMERDLAILASLARLVSWLKPSVRKLRLTVAVTEFANWTLRELDFSQEGRNLEEFRRNFADWEDVIFPQVYWSHTRGRILTMQQVSGLRLYELPERLSADARYKLAKRLAEVEMKMFISDQFFHADLHPGNIFFQPDGKIAVLDVGMVGRMTAAQRDRFLAYWTAISRRQRESAFHHLIRMAEETQRADLAGFRSAYDQILDRFFDRALSERSLAQTYLDVLLCGARYGVVFPSAMILQAKAVVTAEALDLVLAPDFRFSEEVRPIVARELARRASPRRLIDRLWGGLAEWVILGEMGPPGEPPTTDEPDEEAFRRYAIEAVVREWADAAARRLREMRGETSRYSSAEFWMARPEQHALLQNGLGLLRLVSSGLLRVQREADLQGQSAGLAGAESAKSGEARWEAFRSAVRRPAAGGHHGAEEAGKAAAYLESEAASFMEPGYWEDRYESRILLTLSLTLLEGVVGHMERAISESLREEGDT